MFKGAAKPKAEPGKGKTAQRKAGEHQGNGRARSTRSVVTRGPLSAGDCRHCIISIQDEAFSLETFFVAYLPPRFCY
jgi:hypothetical protein